MQTGPPPDSFHGLVAVDSAVAERLVNGNSLDAVVTRVSRERPRPIRVAIGSSGPVQVLVRAQSIFTQHRAGDGAFVHTTATSAHLRLFAMERSSP